MGRSWCCSKTRMPPLVGHMAMLAEWWRPGAGCRGVRAQLEAVMKNPSLGLANVVMTGRTERSCSRGKVSSACTTTMMTTCYCCYSQRSLSSHLCYCCCCSVPVPSAPAQATPVARCGRPGSSRRCYCSDPLQWATQSGVTVAAPVTVVMVLLLRRKRRRRLPGLAAARPLGSCGRLGTCLLPESPWFCVRILLECLVVTAVVCSGVLRWEEAGGRVV